MISRLSSLRVSRPAPLLVVLLASVGMVACNPGTPMEQTNQAHQAGGAAAPLSDSRYRSLPAEQQYQVANRLLTTLHRGVAVDDFFDLSQGLYPLRPGNPNFLRWTRRALASPLTREERRALRERIGLNPDDTPTGDDASLHEFTSNDNDNSTPLYQQIPLAQINDFPLSRDLLVEWMTYFLANTILFSPALEMESTDAKDAAFVYNFLRTRIDNGDSVQDIVRTFLGTQSRWRVSRSAENHALEAYELYLGLFDTAEDSRRGGIACQDWRLTSESADYQLVRAGEANHEYQRILDNYYILDCNDLYNVIVSHPLFMPRITEVIANYLLAGMPVEKRMQVVESVVKSSPETFEDIFTALLFSEAYLLEAERPLWFEENLFGALHRMRWSIERDYRHIGDSITREIQELSYSRLYQEPMGSAAMEYKIGRTPDVPMDALSFSSHSKGMREGILIYNEGGWEGGAWDNGERGFKGLYLDAVAHPDEPDTLRTELREDIATLSAEDYIDYLFLTTLLRPATATEQAVMLEVLGPDGRDRIHFDHALEENRVRDNRWHYADVTEVVMEYVSRLPEFYYLVRPAEEIEG